MVLTAELFDRTLIPQVLHKLFEVARPWEILSVLDEFTAAIKEGVEGTVHPSAILKGAVYVAKGAEIGPCAYLEGPIWIGEGAVVGHAAYIRPHSVLAPNAKLGHASEMKRSVLLPGASAPHFNYLGDSVIGSNVNLGAGVKLANFRALEGTIKVDGVDTGLRKFGAAIGDGVSIGCNVVTSPGTIIGANTSVYQGSMLRGVYPSNTIVKLRQRLELTPKKPTGT